MIGVARLGVMPMGGAYHGVDGSSQCEGGVTTPLPTSIKSVAPQFWP